MEFSTFALSKSAIFDKIKLFTSYLAGKRAEDPVAYDRVAAIELDIPLLTFIIDDVSTYLAAGLGDRVASLETDADIVKFRMRNPAGDQKIIYNLLESYVVAKTIVEWLTIVGYEFESGAVSALKSAGEVASSKLTLLREALADLPEEVRAHATKASPRRVPPI